jgi:Cdc6-like AAA superfamily ATPase
VSLASLVSVTARLVLLAVISTTWCRGRAEARIMEVYAEYARLASEIGLKSVTLRQLRNVLNDLARLGVIERSVRSLGFYGLTSFIKLTSNPTLILRELSEDLVVGGLAENLCSSSHLEARQP